MKQLKKTKLPLVLTVKGKPAAIVQDAAACQHLLDIAASASAEDTSRETRQSGGPKNYTRAALSAASTLSSRNGTLRRRTPVAS